MAQDPVEAADAGAGDPEGRQWIRSSSRGLDAGVAVRRTLQQRADDGEVSWLVAHLPDAPERANPMDTPAVRSLAARGLVGARAVVGVLRRGDSRRMTFARRVLERVAQQSCRQRGPAVAAALLEWVEQGVVRMPAADGSARVAWAIPDEMAWPEASVERLETWLDRGGPCPEILPAATASDAGTDGRTP